MKIRNALIAMSLTSLSFAGVALAKAADKGTCEVAGTVNKKVHSEKACKAKKGTWTAASAMAPAAATTAPADQTTNAAPAPAAADKTAPAAGATP